jgi:hypothetical protein
VITGSVVIDIRDTAPEVAHRLVGALHMIPDNARVIVQVGKSAPHPDTVRLLAEHERRLIFDIHGSSERSVRCWVDALRTGDLTPGAG